MGRVASGGVAGVSDLHAWMIRRAEDGLRARVSGPWTREKLDYVERYAAAFMKAMNPKRRTASFVLRSGNGRWRPGGMA
jgi:hypothetical protein